MPAKRCLAKGRRGRKSGKSYTGKPSRSRPAKGSRATKRKKY